MRGLVWRAYFRAGPAPQYNNSRIRQGGPTFVQALAAPRPRACLLIARLQRARASKVFRVKIVGLRVKIVGLRVKIVGLGSNSRVQIRLL